MITFSLDIDGTWSEDPKCFLSTLNLWRSFGHEVVIVTGREQPYDKLERLHIPCSVKIIVSGGKSKRQALTDHGYTGNIVFVDDQPGLCEDSKILGGDL